MSADLLIPKHVGFIMDGNGRWAKKRGLRRSQGHELGLEHLRDVMRYCADIGIRIVTAYIFSTENWMRPSAEVRFLMRLIRLKGPALARELHSDGVQIRHMGSREEISSSVLKTIDDAVSLTKNNKDYIVNIAFNYGGRQEIVQAIRRIVGDGLKENDITEEVIGRYMYAGDLPFTDLIIRTAGEHRLSNFLLWQSVGCVFYSTPVFWPDFTNADLLNAIGLYSKAHNQPNG